jgi:hypothetical protein
MCVKQWCDANFPEARRFLIEFRLFAPCARHSRGKNTERDEEQKSQARMLLPANFDWHFCWLPGEEGKKSAAHSTHCRCSFSLPALGRSCVFKVNSPVSLNKAFKIHFYTHKTPTNPHSCCLLCSGTGLYRATKKKLWSNIIEKNISQRILKFTLNNKSSHALAVESLDRYQISTFEKH